MLVWEGVIYGQVMSKSNSRQLVTNPYTKKLISIKSKKALKFVDDAKIQLPCLDPLYTGHVSFEATIYYHNRNCDLDESLVMDVLQDKIYKNDNQIKEKHVFWKFDFRNPRVELKIIAIDEIQFNML